MNSPMMRGQRLPEGLPNAWLLDCGIFAEAIAPDPKLTVTQWADERRILSAESSAEPGPWRTDRVPHAREIMDVLSPSDPTPEVTFVAGTQVAKTEIGNNFVGCIIDVAPGPIMMVYPTGKTGQRSSKTRLAKMIDATPTLREKFSEKSRDKSNSATLKEFPGGVLAIALANSAADLKSTPVRYLFEDEQDEYPDDVDGQGPADILAEKRTDTFARKKIFRTSTPTKRGRSKIWRNWLRSDQRRRYVPCPHCERTQVLRWEGFRWETEKVFEVVDESGEIRAVAAGTEGAKARDTGQLVDVWYECEHCAERIEERHKSYFLPRGVWIKGRPEVRGHAGFHLPSYYSPLGWFSWNAVVKTRLEAEQDPTGKALKTWINTVAAEPSEDKSESISEIDLKQRADKTLRLGVVPMGGLMLIGSVDVQGNRLEVKVKAWGRDRESWLIAYEVIHGDTETSAPWDALDEYLQRKFTHESSGQLKITATFVDAGYRTQTVYEFCRTRTHRQIWPVRGQAQMGKAILGRPKDQDIDHNGRKIPNGIKLWPIGTDTAKTDIYARLKISTPGPGCMHFPPGLPDDYFAQLAAERLETRYHHGFLRQVWVKDEGARNEALDLEVYNYACAIMAGLTRINWDALEATLRATVGDLFVDAQRREEQAAEKAASSNEHEQLETAAAATNSATVDEPAASQSPAGDATRPTWLPQRSNWLRRR